MTELNDGSRSMRVKGAIELDELDLHARPHGGHHCRGL
jgi:hypothetical protein